MRIFCAVKHSRDPRYFYGQLWSNNFCPAIRELGHEIVESETDLLSCSRFMGVGGDYTAEELQERRRVTDQILNEVRRALQQGPIDLFLSYFYNSHFDPAGFDELRRLGIPSVNFFCNSVQQFDLVTAIAAKADYSWHPERDARAKYLSIGANPICVQMAADPKTCRPVPGIDRKNGACFVGQRYADRDVLAVAVISAGIPFDLYGDGWETSTQQSTRTTATLWLGRRQPPPGTFRSYAATAVNIVRNDGLRGPRRLWDRWRYRQNSSKLMPLLERAAKGRVPELARVFAAYDVVVNFSNVWRDGMPGGDLVPHVRLRDFEGPMCRTCFLTGHSEEIEECYKVGEEIDTYRTAEELIDKTAFYLSHAESAERLRKRGYERARRDHTWGDRFQRLFEAVRARRTALASR